MPKTMDRFLGRLSIVSTLTGLSIQTGEEARDSPIPPDAKWMARALLARRPSTYVCCMVNVDEVGADGWFWDPHDVYAAYSCTHKMHRSDWSEFPYCPGGEKVVTGSRETRTWRQIEAVREVGTVDGVPTVDRAYWVTSLFLDPSTPGQLRVTSTHLCAEHGKPRGTRTLAEMRRQQPDCPLC